jgi:hypothetical protein
MRSRSSTWTWAGEKDVAAFGWQLYVGCSSCAAVEVPCTLLDEVMFSQAWVGEDNG